MRTIRLSIDAELDLLEIWNYLAEYDEVSADSLFAKSIKGARSAPFIL